VAIHEVGAVRELVENRLLLVELVPYLADDLLQYVLYREHFLEGAPLVYDYGLSILRL
jgi:hypothetical protein